jgi:hypothetical protein
MKLGMLLYEHEEFIKSFFVSSDFKLALSNMRILTSACFQAPFARNNIFQTFTCTVAVFVFASEMHFL